MAEIKINKVKLCLTNNGTPKVQIWAEGTDVNNVSEAIEIIGELESLYALTRKKGDIINTIQKGKWTNLQIDDAYMQVFNSPNYDRVKYLFKRGIIALNEAVNGTRPELDFEMSKMLITDNLDLFLKTQDFILGNLKKSKTEFAKQIVADTKSDDTNKQFNAWKIINDLTCRNLNEVSKEYRIINGEENKIDNK